MNHESPSGSETNFSVAGHMGLQQDHQEPWLSRGSAHSHGRSYHRVSNTGTCLGSHLLPSSGAGGTGGSNHWSGRHIFQALKVKRKETAEA